MIEEQIDDKNMGSHKKIKVTCDLKISDKCKPVFLREIRDTIKYKYKNLDGCFYCLRFIKYSGRNNPNAKFKLNDNFFENIDSEGKAYLLGWVASDGHLSKNNTTRIQIHIKDKLILESLITILKSDIEIKSYKANAVEISISSKKIRNDICKHLNIVPGKKSNTVDFPNLSSDHLKWSFIRGYFDGDGYIRKLNTNKSPRCGISSNSRKMLEKIKEFCNIPCVDLGSCLEWNNNNCLDFLGKIYDNASYRLSRKYDLYLDWCTWVPSLPGKGFRFKHARFIKTRQDAIPPQKNRNSDSGYDLTLLEKVKTNACGVEFYDTGIKIQPEYGWYFELVPRSSITKSGYVLANSIGIIDRTYVGTILVPLIKIDKSYPDLELPCKLCQLIPRQIVHVQMIEVEEFSETERGEKGFGSSGN